MEALTPGVHSLDNVGRWCASSSGCAKQDVAPIHSQWGTASRECHGCQAMAQDRPLDGPA